mgnify:CR=1 FL=1
MFNYFTDVSENLDAAELEKIVGKDQFSNKELLIVHSHGHGDHYVGDDSFEGMGLLLARNLHY